MISRLVLYSFLALTLACFCPAARAEAPKNVGPEVIDLKMGNKVLPFQHRKHQSSVHNECYNCHKTKIGQIDNWGKESAHNICIPCHDLESKGPVMCHECHKKKESSQKK